MTVVESKQSQSNNERFPEVKPTEPGSDTPYIAPIIGKLGYDTDRPWLFGLGTSPNNGVDFHVFLSFDGLNFDDNDIDKIWNGGTADKVKKEVDSATAEIPAAVSAANSAVQYAESAVAASKVNSDAIVAQSEAISEVKSAMDSATAEIQQTAANAASDAAKIRADVAQVQSEVDTASSANSASVEALKSDVSAVKQDIQAAQQANENVTKQLDTYTEQAQAQGKTIKDIQDAQDGYTATIADIKGNVSKISDTVDGLSASLKDDQTDVATLKAQADQLSATLADHDKSIAQLTASAKELSSTLEDADGRLSKVEQTASTLTNEFSDQDGRLSKVEQTATGTQQTVANQQGQINDIKTDVSGVHETITGQGNQITTINTSLNGLNTKYESVSGDLGKLKSQAQWVTVTSAVDLNNIKTPCHEFLKGTVTNAPNESACWYLTVESSDDGNRVTQTVIADQSNNRYTRRWADVWSAWVKDATQTDVTALSNRITTNSTQITQNKQAIALKADQSTVDKLSGEVSQNTAQLKVQADQISSKVSSSDFNTLNDKVNGAISSIQKNSTAIDQTNKQISLKANQTEVDQVKKTATQNSSRLDVMANEISSKVTSTDVNNIVDSKGYATTSTVQSLITQTAGTINESITSLDSKYNTTVTQVQSLTASIDGLQSTVANKADKSQITQLSNVIQSKVSTDDFNNLRKAVDLQTLDSADINNMKTNGHYFVHNLANNPIGGWVYVDVTGNGNDRIRQDVYQDIGNQHKYRRWFGDSWTAWSQDATESEITQLRDDINLRVKSGDLLSQINIQAGRTLIQSQKIYMDADSVIMGPNTRAFIPSAAIINLDVAKLNAGTINTDRIYIGDDSVYLSVKNNYLRLDGSNTKDKYQLRLTGNDIEFADNGSSNWEYRIQHGITKYQTDEDGLNFDVYSKQLGANHTVMSVSKVGVMISPSLFFQTNGIDSSNWMGFTRNTVDGNTAVSFHTWDDNNEGFHVDCGARFMNYVYINGYARAQGWLTNSTLSKKTNIRKLDNQIALDKIRQDDQYLYEYKRNVAKGIYDPQASFIIDDVHDVAHYSVPREFIDQTGKYREPNVELAYLVAAFQALDKQVQEQNETIKKLEAKLNE